MASKAGAKNNIMVDLETLGMSPGAIILSIGAVTFDPIAKTVDTDAGFYTVLSWKDGEALGMKRHKSTEEWWGKQSAEARKVLHHSHKSKVTVKKGLEDFNAWIGQQASPNSVLMWGNGSDFDNALLAVAYELADVPIGWKFWNSRCFRTLKAVGEAHVGKIDLPLREGTFHNALDDAIHQARCAVQLW